jgi:uncharacterized membrane protein
MYKWIMDLLHGQEQPVNAVFCRVKLFLKAIGLQLAVILKILLWMLPGIAGVILLSLPVFQAVGAQAQAEALQRTQGLLILPVILMFVPGAIAALRYAMSEYILAEKPETKILTCVRRSKEMMQGEKKNLFFLMISFLLWYLLELLVASMLTGILSLVFQMFAGLVITVYMTGSVSAFYQRLQEAEANRPKPEEEPEAETVN